MKSYVFIKNTVVLTATSLILRAGGMLFRIYLAGKIGSEGIGLYQLIFSVYVFAATFATSGIATAVTRLIAENTKNGKAGEKAVMRKSLAFTCGFAAVSVGVVFLGADFIAEVLLRDARAALSIRIMSVSLPFMGFCSCFRGYLIAKRKTFEPSISQLFEQAVRMAVVIIALSLNGTENLEKCTASVLLGDLAAEVLSALFLYAVYRVNIRRGSVGGTAPHGIGRQILRISLPIMGGKYMSSALHTAENLLVPSSLDKYSNKSDGLEGFGDLKGMALPILFFPASFLSALATMMIPEISESFSNGDRRSVQSTVERTMELTLLLSIFAAACFMFCGDSAGIIIYGSERVGYMLRMLAPIVPFMYLESIMTGILKGLDRQNDMFVYNTVDSVARIICVLLLVPKFGMEGFLMVMTVSNIMTSSLCCRSALKASCVKMKWISDVIVPFVVSFAAVFLAKQLFSPIDNILVRFSVTVLAAAAVYFAVFRKRLTGQKMKMIKKVK